MRTLLLVLILSGCAIDNFQGVFNADVNNKNITVEIKNRVY